MNELFGCEDLKVVDKSLSNIWEGILPGSSIASSVKSWLDSVVTYSLLLITISLNAANLSLYGAVNLTLK